MKKILKLTLVTFLCSTQSGCLSWFENSKKSSELIQLPKKESKEKDPKIEIMPSSRVLSKPLQSKVANNEEAEKTSHNPDCFDIETKLAELHKLPDGKQFVVSQFAKLCTTDEGTRGYEKDSDWVAIGFPCSGGGGKLKVSGNSYSPTMLSFPLTTDCTMSVDHSKTEEIGRQTLNLSNKSKLLAINPLAVQYYEVKQAQDSGLGFVVELRTVQAKQRLWRDFFNSGKPISVQLYGRQNAWVLGNEIYMLNGQLIKEANNKFKLQVDDVKILSEDEIHSLKNKCIQYNSDKDCSNIFHN